jgi:hypothetical protein
MKTVMFFSNGNTAVLSEDGQQMAWLQEPWLVKFTEFLEAQGEDPTTFRYLLPSGMKASPFRTRKGEWSWTIKEQ